jgi:hypothetical protein
VGLSGRPRLLTALAVGVPLAPIVAGALLTTGGAGNAPPASSAIFIPQRSALVAVAPGLSPVPPGQGALVAQVLRTTQLRAAPGGRRLAKLAVKTGFGSPRVLWVARRAGNWLGVVTDLAGN